MDLQEVFQFDHEMLMLGKSLECIHPILYREEGLLVRINFGKEFLFEHVCQDESSQRVVLVDECDELLQIHFVRLSCSIVERFFETVVLSPS